MNLERYHQKRNFTATPEPTGSMPKKQGKKPIFVVQEHQAQNLHWDFRLEHDGVLASWAVPKGVPQKINEKRLAVQVEDHPFEYKDFEGTIPEGEYGAGTVKIWDSGTFEILEWGKELIEIVMTGQEMTGRYSLIKTKGYSHNSWLLIKLAPKN